jgi:cell fate (sporulation/competence/biofilm development) regulator YlbF (YheA/YmcA/DUF963 family)
MLNWGIESATWALAIFTAILCIASVIYALTAYKTYKASKDQIEALNNLTRAILQLPNIQSSIQDQKERGKESGEAKAAEASRQAEFHKITPPKR